MQVKMITPTMKKKRRTATQMTVVASTCQLRCKKPNLPLQKRRRRRHGLTLPDLRHLSLPSVALTQNAGNQYYWTKRILTTSVNLTRCQGKTAKTWLSYRLKTLPPRTWWALLATNKLFKALTKTKSFNLNWSKSVNVPSTRKSNIAKS